jgi:ATP-dependent phosphoenolpyruvate carboxykinase
LGKPTGIDKANELADAFNKNFEQFAKIANDEILTAAPKRYQ